MNIQAINKVIDKNIKEKSPEWLSNEQILSCDNHNKISSALAENRQIIKNKKNPD